MEHQTAIKTVAAERYILGDMPEVERAGFEAHFFECGVCAGDIRTLSALRDNVRAALLNPAAVADPRPMHESLWDRWFGWLRPAIAAPVLASLIAVVGIQNFVQFRDSSSARGPQTAAQLLLRAEARGDLAAAQLAAGQGLVLSVDLAGVAPAASYELRLEPAQGGAVRRFRAAAPPAGEPLTLVLPAGSVAPGRYVLSVVDQAGGAVPVRYRYEIR